MFASQIQKSVTKTLNTHDRRHPLQAASLDIGDDNVLLQLGRLGVKPKKSQEKLALAAIAAAAAVPVAVYGDSGANKKVNSHGGKGKENMKSKLKVVFFWCACKGGRSNIGMFVKNNYIIGNGKKMFKNKT